MKARAHKLLALLVIGTAALAQGVAAQAQYSVSASPSSVAPGASVSVSWTAPSGSSATDWIGMYQTGGSLLYAYVYTNGATSGASNFTMPQAGTWEFRYYLNNGYNLAATSNTVTVPNSITYTVTASNTTAVSGETVVANYTASAAGGTQDWIGLFKQSSPNTDF